MPPWDATHTGARVAGEAGDKDVEEFAALLRRLKARTDRSYSQLARRLNMNASTLHRYCVGEAVPLDFAPVERFATLCGATPEERLELHRYWILAVAARQRRRDAQPPVESPVPHPAPVPVPAPDAAPEPAARSPWYRRRLTLTAAAVCAVLAVLGSLAAVSRGGSPRTRTVAGTHSGTATGDRTGATPKPTPALPAPLTWTADSQVWEIGCDHDYVIDKAPKDVPPPPVQQDAGVWAATQHAAHGGQTNVEISVQGRSSTAVVLEALRVRVVGRTAPAPGTAYSMARGCGGDISPRYFGVNLDAHRPLVRPEPGGDMGKTVPALHLPYRVSATDPEVLLVKARTGTCDCRWYLELDWSSQGRTGTLRVDDHGKPFRTSSIKGLPHYWYGEHGWTPIG
ncbi:helix-turn-helix domain-containing protein [Streptomyces sp. NBC_01261]|uniref:helix-turn-helix domain-containing protein n=1 Tax=Streptomyces sp. NBC_01261 TaxID=2903802 RepID=UPI002E2F0410|nr:helix-turn-helix transcriptional regulator [Streptomyces sp. NBC_01261]